MKFSLIQVWMTNDMLLAMMITMHLKPITQKNISPVHKACTSITNSKS